MPDAGVLTQQGAPVEKSARQHYLDWLQVVAIIGVFLFHAIHPFDDLYPWHIKNAESSFVVNIVIGFFTLWGTPFFFMMAGATIVTIPLLIIFIVSQRWFIRGLVQGAIK